MIIGCVLNSVRQGGAKIFNVIGMGVKQPQHGSL